MNNIMALVYFISFVLYVIYKILHIMLIQCNPAFPKYSLFYLYTIILYFNSLIWSQTQHKKLVFKKFKPWHKIAVKKPELEKERLTSSVSFFANEERALSYFYFIILTVVEKILHSNYIYLFLAVAM